MKKLVIFSLVALMTAIVESRKLKVEIYEIRERPNEDRIQYYNDDEPADQDYRDNRDMGDRQYDRIVDVRNRGYPLNLNDLYEKNRQRQLVNLLQPKQSKIKNEKKLIGIIKKLVKYLSKENDNVLVEDSEEQTEEYLEPLFDKTRNDKPFVILKKDIENALKQRKKNRLAYQLPPSVQLPIRSEAYGTEPPRKHRDIYEKDY